MTNETENRPDRTGNATVASFENGDSGQDEVASGDPSDEDAVMAEEAGPPLSAYEVQVKLMEMQKEVKKEVEDAQRREDQKLAYSETKKKMDKILEFQQQNGLLIDRWYWVKGQADDWFPACWDEYGWTNTDCWEATFDNITKIKEWKLIPLPEELP